MPPSVAKSYGQEAIELAAMAGLVADDWQRFVTDHVLSVDAAGRWVAFEAGLEVPRQNGKGGIYEIRELAGLFLLGEKLLIHSAHEYKTAEQALDRMEFLIDGCADLSREVKTIKRSHGQEGIYLKSGQVLRYFTRTASGGRGFSCDFLGLDEAMKIKHSMHAAMFPTMSARPNPQILYAGSAVDRETMDDGVVFARIRERGIAGGDPRLAFFGWSAAIDKLEDVTDEDASNPVHWAQANPALGIRISADYIETEQRALSHRGFAVERLGVGDWPATEDAPEPEGLEAWSDCADPTSSATDPVCFSYDVAPNRSSSAIGVAGKRADELGHVEIVDHRPGTGWIVNRLVALTEKHETIGVVVDGKGPGAALVPALEAAGVSVTVLNTQEYAQACGVFVDAVEQRTIRHLDTVEMKVALRGARRRPLGDQWAWSRKQSQVDITPLVASTLAWAGSQTLTPRSRVPVFH